MDLSKEFYYRVLDGDNLNKIRQRFNTEQENIIRNNSEIPLYAGEWIKIKVNDFITHFVKPTETLKVVSEKYSITPEELASFNNLQTEKLFIGQKLKIKLK